MSEVSAHPPVPPVSRGEKIAAGFVLSVYAIFWLVAGGMDSPRELLGQLVTATVFAFRQLANGESLITVFLSSSTQEAFWIVLLLAPMPLCWFIIARCCGARGFFGSRACWGWVGFHALLFFASFAISVFSTAEGTISAGERLVFSWLIGGSFAILLIASVMLYRTRRHE